MTFPLLVVELSIYGIGSRCALASALTSIRWSLSAYNCASTRSMHLQGTQNIAAPITFWESSSHNQVSTYSFHLLELQVPSP